MTRDDGGARRPGRSTPGHAQDRLGDPAWIDVGSRDPEESAAFYGGLLGWTLDQSTAGSTDAYRVFRRGDRAVAGLRPADGEQAPVWLTHVAVEGVDDAAAAVVAAGGKVLGPPVDLGGLGRVALVADSNGGAFSISELEQWAATGPVGHPGEWCWTELACRDTDGAKAFYADVFGWSSVTADYAASTYTMLCLGSHPVAGMVEMDGRWPEEVPAHWMVYVAVDDADATASRAADLGGRVAVPPADHPPGRVSVLVDPAGAVFAVIRLAVPD